MRQTCVKATFTAPCNAPALLPALPPAAAPRHVARTALRQIGAAHEPLSALYRLVRPDTRLSDTPIYSYRTLRYMVKATDGRELDLNDITHPPPAGVRQVAQVSSLRNVQRTGDWLRLSRPVLPSAVYRQVAKFRDFETCSGRSTGCVLHVPFCRPSCIGNLTSFETSKLEADGRPVTSFTYRFPVRRAPIHAYRTYRYILIGHSDICLSDIPIYVYRAHRYMVKADGRPVTPFTSCFSVRHASVHNKWVHRSMVNGCIGP